jgi:hypothetical protein
MTRDEISSFVTNKLGVSDSTSVTRCNDFIQRRFQMIYDADLWKDTPKANIATTVDTTGILAYPAGIDRIIRVRSHGDHALIPVTSDFLIGYDPTIFERTGDPVYYEEYNDSTASYAKKIRVFPIPSSSISPVSLLIVGKMTCPTLAGSDSPSTYVRGIDNCLCAYTQGDMLQRLRQYTKANALYQEAGALLQEMRDVENKQAEKQVVITPDVEPYYDPRGYISGYFAKS